MTAADEVLSRECAVFAKYLSGFEADAYVREKYTEAHQKVTGYAPVERFDRFLVSFAASSVLLMRLADCYARLLAPRSALRKKLVLLLAILESTPASNQFLDFVDSNSRVAILGCLLIRGLGFLASALLGIVFLLPVHVLLGTSRSRPAESQ